VKTHYFSKYSVHTESFKSNHKFDITGYFNFSKDALPVDAEGKRGGILYNLTFIVPPLEK